VGIHCETFGTAEEFLSKQATARAKLPGPGHKTSGINGLDFQRRLADVGLQIPIIFITGHGDTPMTVRVMKSGAVESLTKPFLDRDLLDGIHQDLRRDYVMR
jgi:FixJ family two-component response regulator